MPQSLAELRAANKAEEAAAAKKEEKTDEKQEEAAETKAAEPDEKQEEQQDDTKAEDKSEEGEKKDDDAKEEDSWLKPEGEEEAKTAADSQFAAVRRATEAKVRGKLGKELTAKEQEIEQLRKENEELKRKPATAVATTIATEPKREEFKTDVEYIRALTAHNVKLAAQEQQSEQAAAERKRQQQERAEAVEADVVAHYGRVAELAKKSGIKEEVCAGYDERVRAAIDTVFKGAGDSVTEALIASLGAGSEKVILHLGAKQSKLDHLVSLFKSDRSGIRAAAYLGQLKAELKAPEKRETKAPDPIDDVKGDKAGSSDGANKLKRQYKEAHDKGDAQAAFNIRRKAQKQGISTMGW